MDEIEEDQTMTSSLHIGSVEGAVVDERMSSHTMVDDDDSVDGMTFFDALSSHAKDGDYMMSIGSTFDSDLPTLEAVSEDSDSDSFEPGSDTEDYWFDAHEDDLDDYMASAIASLASGMTPEHLSKVWRISHEEARQMIENTSQFSVQPKGVSLSCKDATNDQMIRYRWIKDYFFMDTFFATKKGGKSSRGHTCCQLFMTDKGFVYVVPMQRKGEVLQALKQFEGDWSSRCFCGRHVQ